MYEMTYVSPDGASFALTSGQIEVAEGGVDKLTGSVKERAYTAVGMPGQLLESHVIEPIRGSLTLVLVSTPTKPAETLAFELRRAFSHHRPGQLAAATPRRGQAPMPARRHHHRPRRSIQPLQRPRITNPPRCR